MSFASIKAAFKNVFNSPDEEIQRRIGEDELNDGMSISKAILENICLFACEKGIKTIRIKESNPDIGTVFYVSEAREEQCVELPMEQAVDLARRIRVLANVDGWGHLDTTPNLMSAETNGNSLLITVTGFQLKPTLDLFFEVTRVDGP